MNAPSARAELYARARRLRWWLAAGSAAAFTALLAFVVTNPIGTQAAGSSPTPPSDPVAAPPQPDLQQPRSAYPPVVNAPQQQPLIRTRHS